MSYASMSNSISHYSQVGRISGVIDADPHRLVQMLLEGAPGKIAVVKGFMKRKVIAKKGELISQAVSIIGGLHSGLDFAAGGELMTNLDNKYDYIERYLLQANIKNDVSILDEVSTLLNEIKSAWESISIESRNKSKYELSAKS